MGENFKMENIYTLGINGELYHWGIKGMKWGVRRYQRKDGTVTPEGYARYRRVDARETSAAKGEYGRKVLAKYDRMKTDKQKYMDKWVIEANRRLNQSKRDRNLSDDFDYFDELDRPNSKLASLFEEAITADGFRAQAYAGAKWYNKYYRELGRAIDKDNREAGMYD